MNKRLFEKLKNWDYSGLTNEERARVWKKKLETYNEDPFICEYCKKPIEITEYNQLHDKMRTYAKCGKVFCDRSHAASYNNLHNSKERYEKRTQTLWEKEEEYNLTDKQIKDAFKKASSVRDFHRLLGMNKKEATTQMIARLEKLNLDINDIKVVKGEKENE